MSLCRGQSTANCPNTLTIVSWEAKWNRYARTLGKCTYTSIELYRSKYL